MRRPGPLLVALALAGSPAVNGQEEEAAITEASAEWSPLAVPVPASGPLDLQELIALAIYNSPELAELRGETWVAEAQVLAAKDIPDPQIRFGYQRDRDVEAPRDEVERIRSTTTESFGVSGGEVSQQNSSAFIEDPLVDDVVTQIPTSQAERSVFREVGSRVTTENTTQRIERGNKSDRIVTDTVETQVERGRTSEFGFGQDRFRNFTGTVPFSERSSESSTTRRRSRTVEERFYNFDRSEPDSDFDVSIRFYVPNPWERKARIKRARATVDLTTDLANALEHRIALDVREAYAELKAADAELTSTESLVSVWEEIVTARTDPEGVIDLDDVIRAEDDLLRAEIEGDTLRFELDQRAAELAAIVGLADPGRISLDSSLAPRALEPAGLEREFLVEVAESFRGELVELRHRAIISRFELKEYNANKIPWLAFVEGFYGVEYTGSDRVADNYGVQVAISLPLFSWFKNKEDEVYKESIRSYNRQAAVVRHQIQTQVDAALRAFVKAHQRLSSVEAAYQRSEQAMQARLQEAEGAGFRGRDAVLRAKESLAKIRSTRRTVYAFYNEALITLERALGTDLRTVFATEAPVAPAPAK